ncbi:hypothetical protein ALCH109712_12875 [Alkalicoccus chagannorensis]
METKEGVPRSKPGTPSAVRMQGQDLFLYRFLDAQKESRA